MSVFKSDNVNYNREVQIWLRQHPGRSATEFHIATLFGSAHTKAATVSNAVSGFRNCGINSFNPHVFSNDDFVAADVMDKQDPAADLPRLQQNATSAGDLPDLQPNATSAGDLPDLQPNVTSAGDLPDPQLNATSAGDLPDPQPNATSAGDLPDPKQNATSAGDLPDTQPNATFAGNLPDP